MDIGTFIQCPHCQATVNEYDGEMIAHNWLSYECPSCGEEWQKPLDSQMFDDANIGY